MDAKNRPGAQSPLWMLKKLDIKFKRFVLPTNRLACRLLITQITTMEATASQLEVLADIVVIPEAQRAIRESAKGISLAAEVLHQVTRMWVEDEPVPETEEVP